MCFCFVLIISVCFVCILLACFGLIIFVCFVCINTICLLCVNNICLLCFYDICVFVIANCLSLNLTKNACCLFLNWFEISKYNPDLQLTPICYKDICLHFFSGACLKTTGQSLKIINYYDKNKLELVWLSTSLVEIHTNLFAFF